MCPFLAIILTLASLVVVGAATHHIHPHRHYRYQAPDECKWYSWTSDGGEQKISSNMTDNQLVTLVCYVRTINSEIEKTNFSVIQPQYTVKLRIVCSERVLYQSSLSAGSFQTLIDLRDLSIEYCKVGNLTKGAFRGLRQLRNLTFVTHNDDWPAGMALNVYSNVFNDDLPMLERLDFGSNNIRRLPDGIFCSLTSLRTLNLTRNGLMVLESLHFGHSDEMNNNDTVECGANIKILDLSINALEILPRKVFSRLGLLEELYLQHNDLVAVTDSTFDQLHSLVILNLAHNNLVHLPAELFVDLRNLKELHLQNNSLNILTPGLFNNLSKLLVLDLSENELTEEWINQATFVGLRRLFALNLANNNLTKLESNLFDDLIQLRVLHLENNAIKFIGERAFTSCVELGTLVLSNNKLKQIESPTFASLSALTLLALDNNRISVVAEDAFANCSSLEDLHLNANELQRVPIALKRVLNLKTLDLGTNRINEVAIDSFPPMSHLVGLRLTENDISHITKGVFDKLSELQIVNLSNNKIRKIESGTFDANLKVVAIRVDGNYLTEVGGLFSKLPNLVWLNISKNFLEWFDYALIPTGLQWLDVHDNKIGELGNHFEIENQLRLSVFDASDNRIGEITGSSIPDNIQTLNLANNRISKIQSYAFFKKFNLTRVNLVGNQLRALTPHLLRISAVPAGRSVPEFLVSNNPFLCDCAMQWLQTYTVEPERNKPVLADLDDAKCELLFDRNITVVALKEATADQLLCSYELECAKRGTRMCDCCDFDACDCKVVCPYNCTCYHSLSASTNIVSCTRAGYYETIPEKIPMNVTQLYLDGNNIPTLAGHSFIGRKFLKILYLNTSRVEIVHNRTFNGLLELEVLRLENNLISALEGNEFEDLRRLKELYLHDNRIAYIQSNMFVALYTLEVLRLDGNRLTQFSIWKLPTSLNTVGLHNNPWTCECQFVKKMREYLQFIVKDAIDSNRIECSNSSLHPIPILSENDNTFCNSHHSPNPSLDNFTNGNTIECALNGNLSSSNDSDNYRNIYLPIIVITVSVVAFLTIFVVFVCAFKNKLRVWCYSKFGVRLFCRMAKIQADDRDKLFDAFVSYSAKDEIFVAEELAPILENGDPPYKLCLYYREFLVGGYLSDTIVQAIESSRRTIMVVSDNFLKFEWNRYEFRSAHHQVLRERRKKLIIIMLGELPFKDIDRDLKDFLKNNTILQWGEKMFWERLRFTLPDVPNNQRYKNIGHRHAHHHLNHHQQHTCPSLYKHHHNCTHHNRPNSRSVAVHI